MESKIILEVLDKLIGNVYPIADSAIDSKRKENMEIFIEVFREMHKTIDDVAYQYSESQYASAKEVGLLAKRQLDDMGISE